MIEGKLKESILKASKEVGLDVEDVHLEHPTDPEHGDYASNVAMLTAEKYGTNSHELAEALRLALLAQDDFLKNIQEIKVAGPGFINFYLSQEFFGNALTDALTSVSAFGKNKHLEGKKVMVEYTDPNPFKEFHIGHLMSNAIGESVSRLFEFSGAEVKRANYQGDVGMHVSAAVFGMQEKSARPEDIKTAQDLGSAYSLGAKLLKDNPEAKKQIELINKYLYSGADDQYRITSFYEHGRNLSLKYFEKIYELLGTKFDEYFFESEASGPGKKIIEEKKGDIFVESDGAVVFPESKSGLHTRVFLNSQGIPTYEAKELALAKLKYNRFPYDRSVVITGNEINEYFKVVHKAMSLVYPKLAEKTQHLSHGMLRLPSGKMSSRTGDVITAMSLIEDTKSRALKKMDPKAFSNARAMDEIAEMVAVGALKYSILRQAPGKDIIFDPEQALSFEGDSGPYLQYTYVRAKSVLAKAKQQGINLEVGPPKKREVGFGPERLLYIFPEVVERATREYAPQYVVTYLTELAGSFNKFYAEEKIVDLKDGNSPHKLALTQAVGIVLKNGLWLLGIKAPEQM